MRYLYLWCVITVCALTGLTKEIGFVERFSLAENREAVLRELVPETEEYYFYHALHALNIGDKKLFEKIDKEWCDIRKAGNSPVLRELRNRQALLDYDKNPKETLNYLRGELGMDLAHIRDEDRIRSKYSADLQGNPFDLVKELETSLRECPKNLEWFTDLGLLWVVEQELNGDQRRTLLTRIKRAESSKMVAHILADLDYKNSRGFGSLPVHELLTLQQMDDLLVQRPALRQESRFTEIYLKKLAPPDGVDIEFDATAREEYLERVWNYVENLEPAHNSLKANVLYNRLRHDMGQGIYNKKRFIEYLKLPRNVHYLRPELREKMQRETHLAELNKKFALIAMPPIVVEEPLVREYLLRFLRDASDYQEFMPFLKDEYLKPLFAESKIVNGVGGPQQWVKLLTPESYQQIRERVDIEFTPDNPPVFAVGELVKLKALVKNVSELQLMVYEINTINYYREKEQPLNLAINLDGMVAAQTHTFQYQESMEQRVERVFELPELKQRGVYVVELIGNGKSSRTLVQKGQFNVIQQVTASGLSFRVWDENNHALHNIHGWVKGREFVADKNGAVVVPFTTIQSDASIVLHDGSFATLVHFKHLTEEYKLHAGIHVDHESLIKGERAVIALRPALYLNSVPTSVKLIEKPQLVVETRDMHGIPQVREFDNLKLREDAETLVEIVVPAGVESFKATLQGSVKNICKGQDEKVADTLNMRVNQIDKDAEIAAFYCGKAGGEYFAELRGKNGEPLAGQMILCCIKSRFLHIEPNRYLDTNPDGRINLGSLADITEMGLVYNQIYKSNVKTLNKSITPIKKAYTWPLVMHGTTGAPLRLPLTWEPAALGNTITLVEKRGGTIVRSCPESIALKNGFVELSGLQAGRYTLFLDAVGEEIAVNIAQGREQGDFIMSANSALEREPLASLNIQVQHDTSAIRIKVDNSTKFTRVHLIATRYLADLNLLNSLGRVPRPELLAQKWSQARTFYESGRDIGDEYRYILERQGQPLRIGNMLERPGLLLNPWEVRTTMADKEQLKGGTEFAGQAAPAIRVAEVDRAHLSEATGVTGAGGYANFDFVRQSPVTLFNLAANEKGEIMIPRETLKGLPVVRVLAVDPIAAIMQEISLDESQAEHQDQRHKLVLEPEKQFAGTRQIQPLYAQKSVSIVRKDDQPFVKIDTVSRAFRLFATLTPDAGMEEFAFITRWQELDTKEQHQQYSKYACHELNFFLYHKDRKFFDSVIKPHLQNKRDKTFMDHWLLDNDLVTYLELKRYAKLNLMERVLLGHRLKEQQPTIARDLHELVEITPWDEAELNRCFNTALQGTALESTDTLDLRESSQMAALGLQSTLDRVPMMAKSPAVGRMLTAGARGVKLDSIEELSSISDALQEKARDNKARARVDGEAAVSGEVRPEKPASGFTGSPGKMPVQEETFFEAAIEARASAGRFYQEQGLTKELAENNYWHQSDESKVAERIKPNRFWAEYSLHNGKAPFLSAFFMEASSNFTEAMFALAVLDLPFAAGVHQESITRDTYTLQTATPLILLYRELKEVGSSTARAAMLVAQRFFRYDERSDVDEHGLTERVVTEEFLPGVVYGALIVITNPTEENRKLDVLMQLPEGAMPIKGGIDSSSAYIELEPFTTKTFDYYFYFPEPGRFQHYPVTLSDSSGVVGQATPFVFNVVKELSQIDKTSWAWVSQHGSNSDVFDYLREHNLHHIKSRLGLIGWRMRERDFAMQCFTILRERHLCIPVLWAYGIYHNIPEVIKELLRFHKFSERCGPWLESTLLTIDPVADRGYQHLEYAPLINPRAHQLGAERTILDHTVRKQVQSFLKILCYKNKLSDYDNLAVAYYMLLQDRITEAETWLKRVKRENINEQMQYDYMCAWLALSRGEQKVARQIAGHYLESGVNRWQERFAHIISYLNQLGGGEPLKGNPQERDHAMMMLAAAEPALSLLVEGGKIRLDTHNLESCTLNFYPVDIELLFSRTPFMQDSKAQFALVKPAMTEVIAIPAATDNIVVDLPATFRTRNVMVEVIGRGVHQNQIYYANTLKVQLAEAYGQLFVNNAESGKPVAGAYIKVYARNQQGKTTFIKDGYTDLLGRFDYISLNNREVNHTGELAILVMSKDLGATVMEVKPLRY